MIELLCKIFGHSPKQVEGANADVEMCVRCGELTSATQPNTKNIVDSRTLSCDTCENEVTTISRFSGDSCPECKRGYLDESESETIVSQVQSTPNSEEEQCVTAHK